MKKGDTSHRAYKKSSEVVLRCPLSASTPTRRVGFVRVFAHLQPVLQNTETFGRSQNSKSVLDNAIIEHCVLLGSDLYRLDISA